MIDVIDPNTTTLQHVNTMLAYIRYFMDGL